MSSPAVIEDTVADLMELEPEARERIALRLLADAYRQSPAEVLHLVHRDDAGTFYIVVMAGAEPPRLTLSDRALNLSQR